MVKYVDSGEGPDTNSKKRKKTGFKVDRRANFERIMLKKQGKDPKKLSSPSTTKSVVFNEAALKEYVTSLHKNKNERRVRAFVDMKQKIKKDSAKTRREQREQARLAYNKYAKVPILPNYTFRLPNAAIDDVEEDEELDEEKDEEKAPLDAVLEPLLQQRSNVRRTALQGSSMHCMPLSMTTPSPNLENRGSDAEIGMDKKRKRNKELRGEKYTNEDEQEENTAQMTTTNGDLPTRKSTLAAFYAENEKLSAQAVTVEVRPLFENPKSTELLGESSSTGISLHGRSGRDKNFTSSLPSADFSDLPPAVEEELRRLRQETKGPSRTKARIATQKELLKIRKIRKHSRKGHGKKSSCGKRKNRS